MHRLRAVTCLRTARNRHVRPRRRFQDFANRQKQRHKQQAGTGTQRQTVTDTDSVTQTRTHREDTRRNRHTDTGTGYSSNPSHRRGAAATLTPHGRGVDLFLFLGKFRQDFRIPRDFLHRLHRISPQKMPWGAILGQRIFEKTLFFRPHRRGPPSAPF